MNKVIAIAGPSGVGKSTIANLLNISYRKGESLVISGDDLHRWERGDIRWESYTHLNPLANNIEKGIRDIQELREGKQIYRNVYCHKTGKFERDVEILPKEYIIHEGLHALYSGFSRASDLKIYVSTSNDLKIKWKIQRDMKKRGYSKEEVTKAINKRIPDEQQYILPQKQKADLLIKFAEKDGIITLKFEKVTENPLSEEIISRVNDTYENLCEFVNVSRDISIDKTLCLNAGGNMSYKQSDKMIVTASGKDFSKIELFGGYVVVYDNEEKALPSSERPSMESPIHLLFEGCVLHAHPVYLNCFLCSVDASKYINEMAQHLSITNYMIEEYISPGKELYSEIKHGILSKKPKIVFLKNHGIFVSSPTLRECLEITKKINQYCKEKLNKTSSSFIDYEEYDTYNSQIPLFPDSVVYESKNRVLNYYTYDNIVNSGMNPRYLSQKEITVINEMEEEKYRKGDKK